MREELLLEGPLGASFPPVLYRFAGGLKLETLFQSSFSNSVANEDACFRLPFPHLQ